MLSTILLLSFIYAGADAKGIVKRVMGVYESWGEENLVKYTHYLECDYQHKFNGLYSTFTYDIHCIQFEGEDNKILTINYEKTRFDKYIVTSCKLEDVVNSVFPLKQKYKYPPEEVDSLGRPTTSYLKYITEDGKCYVRKYTYQNRVATGAKRYTPEEIKCFGNPEWSKYGEVARFSDCQVPAIPLPKIVKDFNQGSLDWYPGLVGVKKPEGHDEVLHCSFNKFYGLYELTCFKVDGHEDYWVYLTYYRRGMARFSVTSCKEDDIVNGIFPPKFTTAHPDTGDSIHRYRFAQVDGKCYERLYYYGWSSVDFKGMNEISCPSYLDEWTNPTMGFAGQWAHCKGTLSNEKLGQQSQVREAKYVPSEVGHNEIKHRPDGSLNEEAGHEVKHTGVENESGNK